MRSNDDQVRGGGFLGGYLLQLPQAQSAEQPDVFDDATLRAQIAEQALAELLHPRAAVGIFERCQQ